MMDIKEVLFQWTKMFFEKKSSGGVVTRADKSAIKSEIMTIQQLAKDIQIINYQKIKVHSSFKDNIWGADLADMQLLSKCKERFQFLLYVFDFFDIYA